MAGALRAYRTARKVVRPYNAVIIKKKSLDATKDIKEPLDFVYIDGDHSYDSVMLDIILWSKMIRKGGVISGHDYRRNKFGVKVAVDDYTRQHGLKLILSAGRNWHWET